MLSSFSTALSALTADETAIDVVGNNLANLNTPGFKDTVVSFSDLISQSLNGQTQVGNGVGTPVTLANFSQGAITATAGPLDAAIQGSGFFIVQGANNATNKLIAMIARPICASGLSLCPNRRRAGSPRRSGFARPPTCAPRPPAEPVTISVVSSTGDWT